MSNRFSDIVEVTTIITLGLVSMVFLKLSWDEMIHKKNGRSQNQVFTTSSLLATANKRIINEKRRTQSHIQFALKLRQENRTLRYSLNKATHQLHLQTWFRNFMECVESYTIKQQRDNARIIEIDAYVFLNYVLPPTVVNIISGYCGELPRYNQTPITRNLVLRSELHNNASRFSLEHVETLGNLLACFVKRNEQKQDHDGDTDDGKEDECPYNPFDDDNAGY